MQQIDMTAALAQEDGWPRKMLRFERGANLNIHRRAARLHTPEGGFRSFSDRITSHPFHFTCPSCFSPSPDLY